MKNFKESFMRLLIIYEHFDNGKLYEDYDCWYQEIMQGDKLVTLFGENDSSVLIPLFVCLELKYLFYEWKTNPPDSIEKMMKFFGLNKKEFCHLFVPGQQNTYKYSGKKLLEDSTSGQVAQNIYFFLQKMLDKCEKK